ncbi:MAG: hypothetical protein ACI4ED_08870 [Suilimivivens sp.]
MKNAIKTVITVLVVIGCIFVSVISFGIYISETNLMEYDVKNLIDPVMKEAEAEYIGKNYNGEEKEGYSYYKITCTLENNSNFGISEGDIYLQYKNAEDEYYHIIKTEEDRPFDIWKDSYYFPAGKTADFYQIICVEDECNEFDVVYVNYKTQAEQRIHINL